MSAPESSSAERTPAAGARLGLVPASLVSFQVGSKAVVNMAGPLGAVAIDGGPQLVAVHYPGFSLRS